MRLRIRCVYFACSVQQFVLATEEPQTKFNRLMEIERLLHKDVYNEFIENTKIIREYTNSMMIEIESKKCKIVDMEQDKVMITKVLMVLQYVC